MKIKKYAVKHHLEYDPEVTVMLGSRGAHMVLTGAQRANPTIENITYMVNNALALLWEAQKKLHLLNSTTTCVAGGPKSRHEG